MDILLISRCLPSPPIAGDRVILHYLADELNRRGHALDLVAFHLEGEEGAGPDGEGPFRFLKVIRERPRSPLDYMLRAPDKFPEKARQCWNPAMWDAIERRLGARRYDVVHFFGGIQVYEFRNLVARSYPTLIVPYESYALSLERALARASTLAGRLRLWAQRFIAQRYEGAIYRGFGRVVLGTESDEDRVRRCAADLPTTVIPNGVANRFFRPLRRGFEAPWLSFIGNFAYAPNVEAALTLVKEVLPKVQARVPETRAVIIGANPPPRLAALAGKDVDVTGRVPDVRPYLEETACFVSPLASGTGIRNKILEAMAMGVPVAATQMSCEGVHVTAGENVLLGETAHELAEACLHLLQDEVLWRRIAEGGQVLVRREHTWGRVASLYEDLYTSLMQEGASNGARERDRKVGRFA